MPSDLPNDPSPSASLPEVPGAWPCTSLAPGSPVGLTTPPATSVGEGAWLDDPEPPPGLVELGGVAVAPVVGVGTGVGTVVGAGVGRGVGTGVGGGVGLGVGSGVGVGATVTTTDGGLTEVRVYVFPPAVPVPLLAANE